LDFNLSQDQQFFRETIRSFVDKEIRPVASELEKSGTYPDEIVKKMKDMGLFGILIPEEYGGQNLDMVSMSILFEEIESARKLLDSISRNQDSGVGVFVNEKGDIVDAAMIRKAEEILNFIEKL
jgi:alkylation response protein AidB-like acyl-CoA dehydrogenase